MVYWKGLEQDAHHPVLTASPDCRLSLQAKGISYALYRRAVSLPIQDVPNIELPRIFLLWYLESLSLTSRSKQGISSLHLPYFAGESALSCNLFIPLYYSIFHFTFHFHYHCLFFFSYLTTSFTDIHFRRTYVTQSSSLYPRRCVNDDTLFS